MNPQQGIGSMQRIYNHIVMWLKSLGREVDEIKEPIDSLVMYETYVQINARAGAQKWAVFLTGDDKYRSKSTELKRLHAIADGSKMIVVSRLTPKAPTAAFAAKNGIMWLLHKLFLVDVRRNILAPPASICTQAEVEELLSEAFATIDELPSMFETDAQAVWLGATVGQVVRSMRFGYIPYHRRVVSS
jgi:DNA-directed RNA polymerase subunit H (RpoH/RPB5)